MKMNKRNDEQSSEDTSRDVGNANNGNELVRKNEENLLNLK